MLSITYFHFLVMRQHDSHDHSSQIIIANFMINGKAK